MKCESCGCGELSLDEIYESYWDSVVSLMKQGFLPKDFAEKEIKEAMRQAELLMKLTSGDFPIRFTTYSPLPEAE